MQLRRGLRQLVAAAALLYVAGTGGELLASRLFDERRSSSLSAPASTAGGTTTAPLSAVTAAVRPSTPSQTAPSASPAANPHCPAYAIPTTGHRPELTKLLEQLVNGAGVKGNRVHLFVDMTALSADHKLLSQLQKSFGVHVHHRSKQVQDKQKTTRPARPWPPTLERADGRLDAAGAGGVDMEKAVGLWYHYAFMLDTMLGLPGATHRPKDGHGMHASATPFGTEYVAILEDDLSVSVDIDACVFRLSRRTLGHLLAGRRKPVSLMLRCIQTISTDAMFTDSLGLNLLRACMDGRTTATFAA